MSSAGEKPMSTPGPDIKNGPAFVADADEGKSINLGQVLVDDTFLPLRDVEPYDGRRILTVRAVVTGGLLGSLIACSNLYLGKIGHTYLLENAIVCSSFGLKRPPCC